MAKDNSSRRRVNRQADKVPLTYYRAPRRQQQSQSPFEKRRPRATSRMRKWVVGVIDIIVLVILISGLVYAMVVQPSPTLTLNETSYHAKTTYLAVSEELFSKVGNRNKLTLNEQGIIRQLQKEFPEISAGSVELPLFSQRPRVGLTISSPAFSLKSQSGIYVVDEQGVAVAKTSNLPGIKNLQMINDQANFIIKPGKQVLSANSVDFIKTVIAECRRGGVELASLSLPPRAQELDVVAKDKPYFVKFYLGGNALVQSGQFLAARHQFEASGVEPGSYLDVRVPGKIFYK